MTRLSKHPETRVESLTELAGIANAVAAEAVVRYRWLAAQTRRRGELETAEAFEALAAEEVRHIAAVEAWAQRLGETVPAGDFRWRLPSDLASSWEEAAQSALLTPYRAYSIAVDNEERAFAFYAYLAASALDPEIAREAEAMAREKLRHAATLRTWRRAAYHRERGAAVARSPEPEVGSLAGLEALISRREAEAAACHDALAARLHGLADTVSADLLARLAAEARAHTTAADTGECSAEACRADRPLGLLVFAQRPLERLCEALEAVVLSTPDDAIRSRADEAMVSAVHRIARLGRRIEQLVDGGSA
jgi:rubrerythrin